MKVPDEVHTSKEENAKNTVWIKFSENEELMREILQL